MEIISVIPEPQDHKIKFIVADRVRLVTKTKRYTLYEDVEGALYIVAQDGIMRITPSSANKIVIDSV